MKNKMKKSKTKLEKKKEDLLAFWGAWLSQIGFKQVRRDLNKLIKLAKREAIEEQRQAIINLENPKGEPNDRRKKSPVPS